MATIPYLQGVLKGLVKGRKYAVKNLNAQPHFIPLNANALKVSLHYLQDSELLEIFNKLDAFVQKYPTLNVGSLQIATIEGIVTDPEEVVLYLKRSPLRIANSMGQTIGVLYASYGAAQKGLFTDFLNKELTDYVNKKAYEASNRKEGFDVGHTYIPEGSKLTELADTPLSLQVNAVRDIITALASSGAGKEFEMAAKRAYGNLYNEKFIKSSGFKIGKNQTANLSAVKSRLDTYFHEFVGKHSYGQKVSIYLSKDIKGFLLNIKANIVLIQDREENQGEFAKVEAALQKELENILPTLHFSKSAEEELADRAVELILFGKVKSKNVKSKKVLEEDNRTRRVKTKGTKITASTPTIKPIRLRTLKGQFTSTTNLETLIRAALFETVKQNMADPALNYQTGRFAHSVDLKSLSITRQGELIAFLSYMKYPYATFEPGGRQGSLDRSPRLLIDKSVREIAKELTTARLRTVIV